MAPRSSPSERIEVRLADDEGRDACLAIRRRVFVEEQRVPEAMELDGLDDQATVWLAQVGGQVVGTARARRVDGFAKAERVAVESAFRRSGVGQALMGAVEAWAREEGLQGVVLHAQESALSFYRSIGYELTGEAFDEAGIPHRPMKKAPPGRGPAP
jgi:predicted GNAT family N-acyltransferase